MTCKDCIHYNVCNMYDGPYISVHLEHTCENFTDRSEWVHLPSDDFCIFKLNHFLFSFIVKNTHHNKSHDLSGVLDENKHTGATPLMK